MGFLNSILFIIILSLTINQFVLHLPSVAATDVLSHGDELNSLESNSTLVSANGNFTLGFFTLYNTYLGIWYNDNDDTKVWVANRDIPMTSSGSLVIDESGTLKVIRKGNTTITNTTLFNVSNEVGSGNTTRVVLKDSGNLVLYDVNSNRTLWQSFDHPTDTLLPGMKLGYNLTTGQNWTLTSWLNDMIPAPGAFELRLESDQNSTAFLVIYRRGKVYWSDDLYNFELFTYGTLRFSEILVSDASGMYITINTQSVSVIMMHLSSMGELLDDRKVGDSPSFCYGYQSNDGCAVYALPNCRGRSDSIQLENGNWEGDFIQYDDSSNISMGDCMQRCWNDCNCKGFSTNDNGAGCFTWGGDAQFILNQEYETKEGVLISQKPLKNVLMQGIELNTGSTLESAGGNFTLGFFTLQNFTYLGIWYTDDQDRKVWVANRDNPMTSNGSLVLNSATLKVVRGRKYITMFNVSSSFGRLGQFCSI